MTSYNHIFNFNFRSMRYLGLWRIPSRDPKKIRLYAMYQGLALLFLFASTATFVIDFFLSVHDLRKVSFNLCSTITATATFFKTIWILKNLVEINRLRMDLERDLDRETAENRRILLAAVAEMRLVLRMTYGMGFSLAATWVAMPLADPATRRHPFPMWVPFERFASPNYEIIYFYQTSVCLFFGSIVFAMNSSIVGFIIRICAEYDILRAEIRNFCRRHFGRDQEEDMNQLKKIVRHHQQIIGFVDRLRNLYQAPLLFQFAGSAGLLAIIGLDIILLSRNLNLRFIVQMQYLVVAIIDLFLFCRYGTNLINKSEETAATIFASEWYSIPPAYQRYLAFVIHRCQRFPKIVLGGMFAINLSLFLEIVKTTYNMLAVAWQLAVKE